MTAGFVVVACGVEPARLDAHPAHHQVLVLPDPRTEGWLDQALQVLGAVPGELPVVVVHSDHQGAPHAVAVLRALARRHRVVPAPSALPPTHLSAAATWLASLAERGVPVGAALDSLAPERSMLRTSFATSSVSGFSVPGVSVGHHLASWVPGLVLAGTISDRVDLGVGRAPAREAAVGAHDQVRQGDARLAPRLAAALGDTPEGEAWELPTQPEGPRWWARVRHYEVTQVPRDVDTALLELGQRRFSTCRHCGGTVHGVCPFCSAREELIA